MKRRITLSKYGYGATKPNQNIDNSNHFPLTQWGCIVTLILFLIWSPFQFGLFNAQDTYFEKPIYWSILITSILAFLSLGILIKLKKKP